MIGVGAFPARRSFVTLAKIVLKRNNFAPGTTNSPRILLFDLTFEYASDKQRIHIGLMRGGDSMSEESGTGEKALFFVLGAFVGATTALLLAPRTGFETRQLIASKAKESADFVASRGRTMAEKTSGYVDRGKEILQQQRDQLSAAIEAGKQAYREEKEKGQS
jgi:gas vesicle protein